jgi:hypothetical protein
MLQYFEKKERNMESKSQNDKVCWFCKKGRHEECMKKIPIDAASEGPHDCTFDTKLVDCQCTH